MMLRLLLLFSGVRFMLQDKPTLTQDITDVIENNTLELTCNVHLDSNKSRWNTLDKADEFSYLTFKKEGVCNTFGFLKESKHYETMCYSNSTFKVKIKNVDNRNHGQEWCCSYNFVESNIVSIYVQVPMKFVTFKYISGGVMNVVEKIKTTFTCETSAGRPAAQVTWIKISQADIETDVTKDLTYNVSSREILSETNMIKVQSSIDIVPHREDNNTRIICKASNMKDTEVQNEALLLVQYPPSMPIFYVDGSIVSGRLRFISGQDSLVICKSDSYPHPTYSWNSTRRSKYIGQYLNISSLVRSDVWQCTSRNRMTLPNKTTISGENYATLKIQLLFPPSKPVLLWGKTNHTVNETLYAIRDDEISILCHSNGYPSPNYKWVGHSPGAKLYLPAIQTSTSKTCIASNELGETLGFMQTSSSNRTIAIIVSYPPIKPFLQFTGLNELAKNGTYLKNKVILEENSSFSVTCKSNGYPVPTCNWKIDRDIKYPTLTFTNISKTATGVYSCFAKNVIKRSFPAYEDKKVTSTDLEIDVQYQSRVVIFHIVGLEQKVDIFEVTEEETIIFYCEVASNPGSSIALSYRGIELAHESSATTLSYAHELSSCNGDEDSVYKCAAQNVFNSKPSVKEIKLMVRCKPRVSAGFTVKSTVSTAQNRNATFEFQAIAKPVPAFRWFKLSGSAWNSIATNYKYNIYTSELYSNMTVRNVSEDDYGYFMLKIQNEVGSLEQFYYLKAKVSLSNQLHFMIAEKDLEGNKFKVNINEEISFMCLSDSDLPSDIVISKQDREQISMTKNTTFVRHTVYKVSCDDAGEYSCAARNILTLQQKVVSNLELIVKCPPIPSVKTNMESPIVTDLHSDVTLQLEVYEYFDDPNNTVFLWYKHNFTLPNDGQKYIVASRGFQSKVIIRSIVITDFGQYKVLVSNSYGQYTHRFELKQKVFPTKERAILESTTARILLGVCCTMVVFVIGAIVVIFIRFKLTRREQSNRRGTGQIADVVVDQLPSIEDDNDDDAHYQEINVYEHLDQQLTEREDYIEMQRITSEDSNKYYITPIHLDQQLTVREDNIEMQSIKSEDSNKYYITPIHL